MTDERSWFRRFIEDFGKPPEGEPTQLIPDRLRMPVFITMVLVSIVLLVLVLWFVVIPGIRAQQPGSHSQLQTPAHSASFISEEVA